MRNTLLLLMLISLPGLLNAQDRWNVFHRTTALIHPKYPSQNLGIEYFTIPKQLSLTGEIGFIGLGKLSEEPFVHSRKYYGEFRYYFKETEDRVVFAGLSYQNRRVQIADTYILGFECSGFESRDCERYMEYSGRLSSSFHEVQLILGAKSYISDWFYFDAFIGMGIGSHLLNRSQINNGFLVERGRFWQERSFGTERLQFNVTVKVGMVMDRLFKNNKDQQPLLEGG